MSVPEDVLYGGVRELSNAIRARRLSPVELAEAYLQRLEQYGPTLGAVVTVTRDRALREARAAEREIAAGQWRGPLHGVPYGVKDLLATAGDPTTWGAEPYRDQRFDFDATIVRRLASAGAVLVALAWLLRRDLSRARAQLLFHYSLLYLALLFVAMAIDVL